MREVQAATMSMIKRRQVSSNVLLCLCCHSSSTEASTDFVSHREMDVIHREMVDSLARRQLSNERWGQQIDNLSRKLALLDAGLSLAMDMLKRSKCEILELSSLPSANLSDAEVILTLPQKGQRYMTRLPDVHSSNSPDETSCHICMDTFGDIDEEGIVQLDCAHIMGRKCLTQWIRTNNSCPLCRRVLFPADSSHGRMDLRLWRMFRSDLSDESFRNMLLRINLLSDAIPSAIVGASTAASEAFWTELHELLAKQDVLEARLAEFDAGRR